MLLHPKKMTISTKPQQCPAPLHTEEHNLLLQPHSSQLHPLQSLPVPLLHLLLLPQLWRDEAHSLL